MAPGRGRRRTREGLSADWNYVKESTIPRNSQCPMSRLGKYVQWGRYKRQAPHCAGISKTGVFSLVRSLRK
jgi:hypothetical protein